MISWIWHWLMASALCGGLALSVGALAVRCIRQPVRRLRTIELTLIAAIVVPLLASIELPWRWSWRVLPQKITALESGSTRTPSFAVETGQLEPPRATSPAPSTPEHATARAAAPPIRWEWPGVIQILPAVYGLVSFMMAAWWTIGIWGLRRLWRRASSIDPPIRQQFREIAGPHADSIEIRASTRTLTPFTFGCRRPKIVLPESLTLMPDGPALPLVLAHEWSHIVRGDLARWRFTRLAQLVLWYQPVYWWLRQQVRLCQDQLADAEAAEHGTAVDLAQLLLDSARTCRNVRFASALPFAWSGSDLSRRIHMLLKYDLPLERRCPLSGTLAGSLVTVAAIAIAGLVRLEAQDTPAAARPAQAVNQSVTAQAVTYHCRVVERGTRKPIAGATVVIERGLHGDPRYSPDHELETTTYKTDADGRYEVTISAEQAAERYLYIQVKEVSHPEYQSKTEFGYAFSMIRKNEALGGRPFFETTELAPGKAVTGTVVLPDGRPAADIPILAYSYAIPRTEPDFHHGSFDRVKTDKEGRFRLVVPHPGAGAFWLQPEKFALQGHISLAGGGDIGKLTLKPGIRLAGRVLDADGKPVAGMHVEAMRRDSEGADVDKFNQTSMAVSGYSRNSTTDAEGRFRLDPVESGKYEFRIELNSRSSDRPRTYAGAFAIRQVDVEPNLPPLEFRAVPTVEIRARNFDSQGQPIRGFDFHISGNLGENDEGYFARSNRPVDGRTVAQVPRGLRKVVVRFTENEHGTFRIRRQPGAALENIQEIEFPVVETNIEGIEVVRYKAPILLVKAVDAAGEPIESFTPKIEFSDRTRTAPRGYLINDIESDVSLERQSDGRWRSEQLLPDEDITVSVIKAGWTAKPQTARLVEGEQRELVFTMTK